MSFDPADVTHHTNAECIFPSAVFVGFPNGSVTVTPWTVLVMSGGLGFAEFREYAELRADRE